MEPLPASSKTSKARSAPCDGQERRAPLGSLKGASQVKAKKQLEQLPAPLFGQ